MTKQGENNLQYAEQLLRGDKKQEARVVLSGYLQSNPSSAQGWWLLSFAVTDPNQKIECVERVLRITPNNIPAQIRLKKLQTNVEPGKNKNISEQFPRVNQESIPGSSSKEAEISQPVQSGPDTPPIKKKTNLILPFAFFSMCIFMGVIGFIVVSITPFQTAFSFALQPSSTPFSTVPPQTMPPTWTPVASSTPIPSQTLEPVIPTEEIPFLQTETDVPNFDGWLATGAEAPDFTMKDVASGQRITLSDYRGHPIILFFFVTWCEFCDGEVPALKNIYEEYKDEGLIVLAVDERESAAKARSFRDDYNLSFPVLNDQYGELLDLYKGTRYPTNYFIDSDGKISTFVRGMMDYASLNIRVLVLLNRISTPVP